MTTLYLSCDSFVETTREADSNDSWDRGDSCTTWSFGHFHANKPGRSFASYESCDVEGEVHLGDTVYAVIAIWSDGDSFGHDESRRAEIFYASTNADSAASALSLLRDEKKPDGTAYMKYELPWHGYFESLDELRIHEATVVA